MHISCNMGISVERKSCICMPKDSRQRFRIHSACKSVGGEGMAQVVKPDYRQTCIFKQDSHTVVSTVGRQRYRRVKRIFKHPLAV